MSSSYEWAGTVPKTMVLAQMEQKGEQAERTGCVNRHARLARTWRGSCGAAIAMVERQEEPEDKVARKQRKRPGQQRNWGALG